MLGKLRKLLHQDRSEFSSSYKEDIGIRLRERRPGFTSCSSALSLSLIPSSPFAHLQEEVKASIRQLRTLEIALDAVCSHLGDILPSNEELADIQIQEKKSSSTPGSPTDSFADIDIQLR